MISCGIISNGMSLKKVIQAIEKNNRFLISTHINPECDAIGSELSFKGLLDRLGKTSFIINEQDPPRECKFLPGLNAIKGLGRIRDFDILVVLDCSNLSRIGKVSRLINKDKFIINIDHHISNSNFADINWVDPKSSSVCEMVYRLYKKLKIKFDKNAALSMYAGILTDTGCFRYSNTTAFTHRVAADLLENKISVNKVYRLIYASFSFDEIKFLGREISKFNIDNKGKIIWLTINRVALKKNKISMDLTDNILHFARAVKGVEVVLLFKEMDSNQIRVNLRSNGSVDVNHLAKIFGGGGHRTASGFTVKGDIHSVENQVLREVRKYLY